MNTAKIYGNITQVQPVETLTGSGRKVQKITVTTTPQPDALGRINEKPNVYNVFIYGEDITSTWAQHNDNLPTPPVTLTVQLVGRNKYANGKLFNNITLRLLKIKFHYE